MDPIEKLLAEIKAEGETPAQKPSPAPPAPQPPNSTPSKSPSSSPQPRQGLSSNNLESLLERVKQESAAESSSPRHSSPQQSPPQPISIQPPIPGNGGHVDNLLNSVKSEFEEIEQAERLQRERSQREEARRQEQLKQQRREALAKRAQEWLKKLDPYSDEGFWFGQFAEHYASKLEAAIAYLEATPQKGEG